MVDGPLWDDARRRWAITSSCGVKILRKHSALDTSTALKTAWRSSQTATPAKRMRTTLSLCCIVKLPICGSKIRQNLPNANYSNLPLLWQPAVKDAAAAKRNNWRGPAQRGGGRLCRLRVSLRAACQSGTQRPRSFLAPNRNPKRSQSGIPRAKPLPS